VESRGCVSGDVTLFLGFMHDGKIAGKISIVLVQQVKHQAGS
jgi:hypothetical protein